MTLIGDCGWPLNYVYSCVLNEAMHISLWVSDDLSHIRIGLTGMISESYR